MSELQQQQQQPQQQQQQPVLVYPNTAERQPPAHHSNGSFGAVFIVLAVIVVISALACFLGRLCNRRVQNQKPKPQSHNNNVRPKGKEPNFHPNKEGDIEFGFDMRNPNGKLPPNGNGGSKSNGKLPPNGNGGSKSNGNGKGKGKGGKPFDNGSDMLRNEIKHTHEVDFKAAA